jgi:hypothetical protein
MSISYYRRDNIFPDELCILSFKRYYKAKRYNDIRSI